MRLNQITVGATDFAESVAFHQLLGFRLIVSARGEYARFEVPEGEATFSIHLKAEAVASGSLIYLEVDDVDAIFDRLTLAGIPSLPCRPISHGFGGKPISPTRRATSSACITLVKIGGFRLGELIDHKMLDRTS